MQHRILYPIPKISKSCTNALNRSQVIILNHITWVQSIESIKQAVQILEHKIVALNGTLSSKISVSISINVHPNNFNQLHVIDHFENRVIIL